MQQVREITLAQNSAQNSTGHTLSTWAAKMANHSKFRKRDRCWFKPSETYETSSELIKIHKDIRLLYLSGVQLFTKDSLRAVAQQLQERNEKTDKVYVKGINGDPVDFTIRSGSVISTSASEDIV